MMWIILPQKANSFTDGLFIDPVMQPDLSRMHIIALAIWNRGTPVVALFVFWEVVFIRRKRIIENSQERQDAESQRPVCGFWRFGKGLLILSEDFWNHEQKFLVMFGSGSASQTLRCVFYSFRSCTSTHFLQNRLSVISWNNYLLWSLGNPPEGLG